MNILIISETTAFSDKSYGGAESSLKLISEKLNEVNQKVFYLTRQKKKNIDKTLIPNNLKFYTFPYIRGSSRIEFLGKINAALLSTKINKLIDEKEIHVIYCFYQLGVLKALERVKKQYPNVKIVMRMAGLYWYEKSKETSKIKQKYETYFNMIDSVNYIHTGLETLTNDKLNELEMDVEFKHKFHLDIGTSFAFNRSISYQKVTEKNSVFKIIMATRFSNYQKRQDILVEAAKLMNQNVDFHITLIGNGSEKEKIQSLIDNNNLNHRIKIIPFLDQKTLWELMQNADLLAHACEYEGLGKIIIESMAMGLPVLASNVIPINHYIEDGKNGFLVDNQPEKWAKKIIELITDQNSRINVSNSSIKYIREHYNPDVNIKKYVNMFNALATDEL